MPWYLAHGVLIAYLVVGGLAALPIGLVWIVRALRDRRLAGEDRETFTYGICAPAEQAVTLRGTLRGTAATSYARLGERHHTRSEELWLDHDGLRVDLIGAVRIVRGTRARAGWRQRRYEVRDGDAVMVRGTAKRIASSYREQCWQLEADGELEPIALCASRPASRAQVIAPAWMSLILVTSGVGAWLALHSFGAHQLAKYPRAEAAHAIKWSEPAALAAITPGNHDRALAYLYALYTNVEPSQGALDARVEIAEQLRGQMRMLIYPDNRPPERVPTPCEAAAWELVEQNRYEEALDRGCTDGWLAASINLALGYYAKVAPAKYPIVDVAAGRWEAAAASYEVDRPCIAVMLRAFVHQPDAPARARALATTPQCEIAAIVAELAGLGRAVTYGDRFEGVSADLRWAFDPSFEPDAADALIESHVIRWASSGGRTTHADASLVRRTWLSAQALDRAPDVHVFRMLAAVMRGDRSKAVAELALAGRPRLQTIIDARLTDICDNSEVLAEVGNRLMIGSSTLAFVTEAAAIRDRFRAAGDTQQAARWRAIVDRHLAAFADPQRVLATIALDP